MQESRKNSKDNAISKLQVLPKKRKTALFDLCSDEENSSRSFDELLELLATPGKIRKGDNSEQLIDRKQTQFSSTKESPDLFCTPANSDSYSDCVNTSQNHVSRSNHYKSQKTTVNVQTKVELKRKLLIGKRRRLLHSSSLQSSKTIFKDKTLKSLNSCKEQLQNSFNQLFELLLTPPSKSDENTEPFKTNKKSCSVQDSGLLNGVKSAESKDSFEKMLNSWLTPPSNEKLVKKEDNFENFLNQILSPDLGPSSQPQKTNTKSKSKKVTTAQERIKRSCNKESSTTNEEISFREVLKNIFRLSSKQEIDDHSDHLDENCSVLEHESFVSNVVTSEKTYVCGDSSQKLERFHDEPSYVNILTLQRSTFDTAESMDRTKEMSQILKETEFVEQKTCKLSKKEFSPAERYIWLPHLDDMNSTTEMGTQTSFDQCLSSCKPIFSEENICDVSQTSSVSETSSMVLRSGTKSLKYSTDHCLNILSRDLFTLSDGRTMLNISKIGTPQWLETAFKSVSNVLNLKRKKVSVLETHNCLSLYVNYCENAHLDHYKQNDVTICKIKKIQVSQNTALDVTQRMLYVDNEETKNFPRSQRRLALGIDKICRNKELIRSDYKVQIVDPSKIRLKIHSIFAKLHKIFENDEKPVLVVKGMKKEHFYKQKASSQPVLKKFGNNNSVSSYYAFYRVLYIMAKIYLLLQNNTKLTKREIFYQIKHLVKTQNQVNNAIDSVSHLLGLGQWHLNIINQSGLVYGNLKLFWSSGEVLNCNAPATLIPPNLEDLVEVQSTACFILVVEKESIYVKLLQEDLPNKLARPFIMITGKGMPDIGTRLFLNRISRMLSLPVFILVDADIFGIRIMLTYRFGSLNNFHLNDDLAVPNARWLGVFPSEITKYGITCQSLTKTDKVNIKSLLRYIGDHPKIEKELQLLLDSNQKASIEGVMKSNTFLSDAYLPVKFFNQSFI